MLHPDFTLLKQALANPQGGEMCLPERADTCILDGIVVLILRPSREQDSLPGF